MQELSRQWHNSHPPQKIIVLSLVWNNLFLSFLCSKFLFLILHKRAVPSENNIHYKSLMISSKINKRRPNKWIVSARSSSLFWSLYVQSAVQHPSQSKRESIQETKLLKKEYGNKWTLVHIGCKLKIVIEFTCLLNIWCCSLYHCWVIKIILHIGL